AGGQGGEDLSPGQAALVGHDSSRSRWSASRAARATSVIVGAATPGVANTLLPATYRLAVPWTRRSRSTTPWLGSAAIRVVHMWWLPWARWRAALRMPRASTSSVSRTREVG